MKDKTVWQIWLSPDETYGTTCLRGTDNEQAARAAKMDLLHQFECDGSPEVAFKYANWWRYDEGKRPRGVRPLDQNKRLLEEE